MTDFNDFENQIEYLVYGCSPTCSDNDNTPSFVDCPSPTVSLNNDRGQCCATDTFSPTATDPDACAVLTEPTQVVATSGPCFADNDQVRWEVSDSAGQTAECTWRYSITDTEDPVITCPSDIVADNTSGLCSAPVGFTTPLGTDNCASTTSQLQGLSSGSSFPVGATPQRFRVEDLEGNVDECQFVVTVDDIEPPVASCPSDITENTALGVCSAQVFFAGPAGSDNCPGAVFAVESSLESGDNFPRGTSTVSYSAVDASSSRDLCFFDVTVVDDEPPSFSCPASVTASANDPSACGMAVSFTTPVGIDNCPGVNTVQTGGISSGAFFPVGLRPSPTWQRCCADWNCKTGAACPIEASFWVLLALDIYGARIAKNFII